MLVLNSQEYTFHLFSKVPPAQELIYLLQVSEEWLPVIKHNRYLDKTFLDAYSLLDRWENIWNKIIVSVAENSFLPAYTKASKTLISLSSKDYNSAKFGILSDFWKSDCPVALCSKKMSVEWRSLLYCMFALLISVGHFFMKFDLGALINLEYFPWFFVCTTIYHFTRNWILRRVV